MDAAALDRTRHRFILFQYRVDCDGGECRRRTVAISLNPLLLWSLRTSRATRRSGRAGLRPDWRHGWSRVAQAPATRDSRRTEKRVIIARVLIALALEQIVEWSRGARVRHHG